MQQSFIIKYLEQRRKMACDFFFFVLLVLGNYPYGCLSSCFQVLQEAVREQPGVEISSQGAEALETSVSHQLPRSHP